MMTPQLTEQYGQVLRVSLAREILRVWAWRGVRSNPRALSPAPPTRVPFRNVLRENSIFASARRHPESTEVDGCDRREDGQPRLLDRATIPPVFRAVNAISTSVRGSVCDFRPEGVTGTARERRRRALQARAYHES